MTFVPDKSASPRLYQRHQHYARPARLRYSAQKFRFLNLEEARLSTGTFVAAFNFLKSNSAFKISEVASTTGLQADPYPATSA